MNDIPVTSRDAGTTLAAERTLLAYERTLMAWVRTATSLISFGFTIYKFFEFEAGKDTAAARGFISPRLFAMIMILTGLIALALSTVEYRQNLNRLRGDFGTARGSVTSIVAGIVAGLGLLALLATLFKG